jgi:transcriptional regulator NrdR family protein
MRCLHCTRKRNVKIIDSRPTADGMTRRRYVCPSCKKRWTTLESIAFIGDEGMRAGHPGARARVIRDIGAIANKEMMDEIKKVLKRYTARKAV